MGIFVKYMTGNSIEWPVLVSCSGKNKSADRSKDANKSLHIVFSLKYPHDSLQLNIRQPFTALEQWSTNGPPQKDMIKCIT